MIITSKVALLFKSTKEKWESKEMVGELLRTVQGARCRVQSAECRVRYGVLDSGWDTKVASSQTPRNGRNLIKFV